MNLLQSDLATKKKKKFPYTPRIGTIVDSVISCRITAANVAVLEIFIFELKI